MENSILRTLKNFSLMEGLTNINNMLNLTLLRLEGIWIKNIIMEI